MRIFPIELLINFIMKWVKENDCVMFLQIYFIIELPNCHFVLDYGALK